MSCSQVIILVKSPGRDYKIEQQGRGRRAKRGRGRQTAVKAVLESEPAVDPQPDPQEKAEPVPSKSALPEPEYQQQPPMLTIQNMVDGMQAVATEVDLADRSLDPAGELQQSFWPVVAWGAVQCCLLSIVSQGCSPCQQQFHSISRAWIPAPQNMGS